MAITRTTTTFVAYAEINDDGGVDVTLYETNGRTRTTRSLTPQEATQLADELRAAAVDAAAYATEVTA